MFKLTLNDRELRALCQALSGLEVEDVDAREFLLARAEEIVDEHIDALERIEMAEGGQDFHVK